MKLERVFKYNLDNIGIHNRYKNGVRYKIMFVYFFIIGICRIRR